MTAILECIAGLILAAATLRDVFDTVVVPGRTRGSLKVSRRLVMLGLFLRRPLGHKPIGVNFAPIALLGSFVVWMLLLVLGFALTAHALRDSFTPALDGFGEALYVAGSALATIGLGRSDAEGLARGVVVGAGFCGLAVMTMAVTYLLEVQNNIAQRDTGVLKLSITAGDPPSALGLMERYAELGCRDELAGVLRAGRDWCAAVFQSHASHPSLIYFRSAGVGAGWPATLGTLADLALLIDLLLDEPELKGPAALMRQQGRHLAQELTSLLHLPPAVITTPPHEVAILIERLGAAGYRLRADIQPARFIAARAGEVACIEALSGHLGTDAAPLLPRAIDTGASPTVEAGTHP
jgi:hypothetical protein